MMMGFKGGDATYLYFYERNLLDSCSVPVLVVA